VNDPRPLEKEPLLYQAIGLLQGKLNHLDDGSHQLECSDSTFAVRVKKCKLRVWLETHPDKREGIWSVYPRQQNGVLSVELVSFIRQPWNQVDYFKISGRVVRQDPEGGKIIVSIRQNNVPPGKSSRFESFKLELLGHVPGKVGGEIWQFDCVRSGHQLEILDGTRIAKRLDVNLKLKTAPQAGPADVSPPVD